MIAQKIAYAKPDKATQLQKNRVEHRPFLSR